MLHVQFFPGMHAAVISPSIAGWPRGTASLDVLPRQARAGVLDVLLEEVLPRDLAIVCF